MWAALGVYRFAAAVSIQRPGGAGRTRDSLRCYPVRLRSTRLYVLRTYGVVAILTVFYREIDLIDRSLCAIYWHDWPINSSS